MNTLLFFAHTVVVLGCVLGALRLGREALVVLVSLFAVIANLFVLKQVTLFGLTVTCPDVYVIGSMMALNLLQEYFGREAVKRAIIYSFASLILFGVMAQFHLLYRPASADWAQGHYQALLGIQPRILGASLVAFLTSQLLDYRLFRLLKGTQLPVGVRSGLSLFTAQVVDTVLFATLGLWGKVESLSHIIFLAILIKGILIACSVPFTQLSRRVHAV
ncbi:MAG: queuosine precursor transporter [Parachlamydiales bacterium]